MSPELAADVSEGVLQLQEAFPGRVFVEPDGQGGGYVTVREVPLGTSWASTTAPVSFQLPYNYPSAPPYPFYVPVGAAPPAPWPPALQRVSWRGQEVIQISLRHTNWNPVHDSAVGSVIQVSNWLGRAP